MQVNGSFVTIDNTPYYKISNSEKLAPFFIQVVSSSDIWIYMSSIGDGGLTAGRKNAENNLFPYETEDRLRASYETGSKTIVKVDGKFWQPFEKNGAGRYAIQRNIYKSCYGDSVIMEELNNDLNLAFSYHLQSSEKYGVVKTSKLHNFGSSAIEINVLDGFMNIMPFGVNSSLQNSSSSLVDAYKAAELEGERLAVYSLTTMVNDTPYPVEMLKANIAYCTLSNARIHLDPDTVRSFTADETEPMTSSECYGKKSAYLASFKANLDGGEKTEYTFILDCGYDHSKIAEIEPFANGNNFSDLFLDITAGTNQLVELVADADGIQSGADSIATSSHFVNTLYNLMRGGTFEGGYLFDYNLFLKFVEKRNFNFYQNSELLQKVKNCKTIMELKVIAMCDPTFYRLALEFMPLSFSRRHGDPSRPWNKFNIALKDEEGNKLSGYEGNWRDIFQNWEALGLSFPAYYENMVAKFVNATTIDGFNPYRINNDGIDWEKPEPENPFSGLGYWGDHQIIYLLRLLQGIDRHFPNQVQKLLDKDIFSYANVPYILKDYSEIVKNPKSTIIFDAKKDHSIEEAVKTYGTDAKLLMKDNKVYTANLAEKLLVPALSKISNLLPGGGIWMNTDRPEWNDANNAIVGIGLSVVTVYHLKAYLEFIKEMFSTKNCDASEYKISSEVFDWLVGITLILDQYKKSVAGNEKNILDAMGEVFSNYRNDVYQNGFSTKKMITVTEISDFINSAICLVDYTIDKNQHNVFVSYNLLKDDFSYIPMRTMLEGQSAAVASGTLGASQVCDLIHSMKNELYCEDGGYHTLYPIKKTKRFTDKNSVTGDFYPIKDILLSDKNGSLHFASSITSQEKLIEKCTENAIPNDMTEMLLSEYEKVFLHKSFNGRSDVIYKFEGIGCAYWHQNAKFALGVLETAQKAYKYGADFTEIYNEYNDLLHGFIYRKTPGECGAIPIEPYSHTSYNRTSEQPGMTGQVKESVIMRRGELGVIISDGKINFAPEFLRRTEFDENGELSFSLCGTQIKYINSGNNQVNIHSNTIISQKGYTLDQEISSQIFYRNKNISLIEVFV